MLTRLVALLVLVVVSGCAQSAPTPTLATGLKPVDGTLRSLSPAGPSAPDDGDTPFAPAGPLLGVVMAAGIDERGHPVEPGITFPSSAEQIVAIVPVGEIDRGEVLTVTWYHRAGPDARQALFEHSIDVESSVYAYSTGVSKGALLAGVYEVVARLGDHEVSTRWILREEVVAGRRALKESLRPPRAAASDAEAGPPLPGESGSNPVSDEDRLGWGESPDADECHVAVAGIAALFFILAEANERHCTPSDYAEVVLAGRVRGAEGAIIGKGDEDVEKMFHPCQLPDGNDLPGTVIELGGWGEPDGPESKASLELKDPGFEPLIGIMSEPKPGSEVRPGQTITIEVEAMQPPPGLGLRSVELSGPSGVIAREAKGEPVPCDPKRHFALLRGTLVVPDDGRDVIELQAVAIDQKEREGRATAQYFISQPGTWTGRVTWAWEDVPQNETARLFDIHNFRDGQADVTLREVPSPLVVDGKVVGELIQLDETGTIVTDQMRQRGTTPSHVCDGEGTGKIARGGMFSRIVRKTEPVDLTGILGLDVPVGESYYWIWPDWTAVEPPTFPFRCQIGDEEDASFILFTIGNLKPGTVSPGLDTKLRVLGDGGKRMQGTWTWREGPDSLTVTWDLVRSEPGG